MSYKNKLTYKYITLTELAFTSDSHSIKVD